MLVMSAVAVRPFGTSLAGGDEMQADQALADVSRYVMGHRSGIHPMRTVSVDRGE
jgi:hypothetical protein